MCYVEGRLRLIEGTSDRNGLLQIYFNGTWHYFCYFTFSGLSQACSQLGFQTTGYTQAREINVTEMYSASCSSSDTYLYPHCDISDAPICFLNLAINLTCTVDGKSYRKHTGNFWMTVNSHLLRVHTMHYLYCMNESDL